MYHHSTWKYLLLITLLNGLSTISSAEDATETYELLTSTQDLSLIIHDNVTVWFKLNRPANETIKPIKLACHPQNAQDYSSNQTGCDLIDFESNHRLEKNQSQFQVIILGHQPGSEVLAAFVNRSKYNYLKTDQAFVRISVGRNHIINVISNIIGWIYFVAWSISFYPQIWTNFKRRSVVGLNFDFIGLNITGFLFYSIFNCGLYFNKEIQSEFFQQNKYSQIPVELNDVVFGVHAAFATLITIIQCFIYERNNQKLSIFTILFLTAVWIGAVILLILVPTTRFINWFSYLYYFSSVKLAITICKYIPQAWFNYKRKSTEGWSIGNILLDFTGGSLSMGQMFLLGYNYDDITNIFTNFTKFGLGFVSILFDILFMVQHYILYRDHQELDLSGLTHNRENNSADGGYVNEQSYSTT